MSAPGDTEVQKVRMQKISIIGLVCCLVLALSAPAYAQSSTQRGYDETTVLGGIESSDDETAAPTPRKLTSNELPFTGLDVAVVAMMGAALLGTGFAIRRTARRQT